MIETTKINVCTTDVMPPALVDVLKSEARDLMREKRTRTFVLEFRSDDGVMLEARLRTRGRVIVVPLTS